MLARNPHFPDLHSANDPCPDLCFDKGFDLYLDCRVKDLCFRFVKLNRNQVHTARLRHNLLNSACIGSLACKAFGIAWPGKGNNLASFLIGRTSLIDQTCLIDHSFADSSSHFGFGSYPRHLQMLKQIKEKFQTLKFEGCVFVCLFLSWVCDSATFI